MLLILIIVTSIHLLLTVLFAIQISGWKSAHSSIKPSFSIIIAARDEFGNLKKLIPELLSQEYPDFEIIVSLDRCTDQSKSYLQSVKNRKLKFVEVASVPENWNAKKYALTQSITLATNDWLVFTDADCIPDSDQWLKSISLETTPQTHIIIGISPYLSEGGLLSHYIRFEAFMTSFLYSAFTMMKKPYMAVGRNMAIRKSFFKQTNGYKDFKSILGGDDDLFIQKNASAENTRLMLGKNSLINTFPSYSWKNYFQQKMRHFSVSSHYSIEDQQVLSIYHLSHFLTVGLLLLFWNHAYFFPILLFYLFIKFVSYRFAKDKIGSGFNYILLPIVDIMYAIFTPVIGIWSKLEKDIKWKN